MATDSKRTVFEGQAVLASRDIANFGSHRHITIDPSSMLRKPGNITIAAGTPGYVKEIDRTNARILVKFRPNTNTMVALWIDFSVVATNVQYLDSVYTG